MYNRKKKIISPPALPSSTGPAVWLLVTRERCLYYVVVIIRGFLFAPLDFLTFLLPCLMTCLHKFIVIFVLVRISHLKKLHYIRGSKH